MKIRLAKKIWDRKVDRTSPYWMNKMLKSKVDNRIIQASRKVTKWKGRSLVRKLRMFESKTCFNKDELKCANDKLSKFKIESLVSR